MMFSTPQNAYRPKIIESAFVDFISERINPFWSPVSSKAKLTRKLRLNDSLVALELTPNRLWLKQLARQIRHQHHDLASNHQRRTRRLTQWQAGQHISLSVKLDGIYHHRYYSLVGTPDLTGLLLIDPIINDKQQATKSQANKLMIALKQQGRVSDYLAYEAKVGETFDIGLPEGDFTLEHHQLPAGQPVGFIASGSGITPMPGLITEALESGDPKRPVTLLYYYHPTANQSSPAFLSYWQALARQYPNFHYYIVNTNEPSSYLAGGRHLNADTLQAINLSPEHSKLFVCGAPAMMQSLPKILNDWSSKATLTPHTNTIELSPINGDSDSSNSASNQAMSIRSMPNPIMPSDSTVTTASFMDNVATEFFGHFDSQPSNDVDTSNSEVVTIWLRRRQRQFQLPLAGQHILMGAQTAHIRLPHGCRQGICNMCRCDKVSGVVKDSRTGKLSGEGFESIKPCISLAMGDVVLDV
ncbi:MAG: iron-sulfur cluster-binding domain-containing protein [Psychrobacter sp.]|nr:iron-sulfur cluster-binding domain-containing protein [Psychrobacter sp.]